MALPIRGLFLVVSSLAAAASLGADDCKFNAERSAGMDRAGVSKVIVLAGAGDLDVTGSATAKRIEGHGKACASSQKLLDQTVITVTRNGSIVTLQTDMPELDNNGQAMIDLSVTLPSNLPVEVMDSSGDAEVKDVKSLAIQDSSGDVRISAVAELADVRDSSGDIAIHDTGSVKLQDSSGDITVRDVKGDVEVTSDSSGGIEIRGVNGLVHILQDSSGDILVTQVKGNVTVDSDSSGSINVDNIGGDFTVTDDSSGGVKYKNVTGRVSVP
jgi:DUF4097 and DUF4098 domain-containing protein YvlB